MKSLVMAESLQPRKRAIIERLTGDFAMEYRVVVSNRYTDREQAVNAFLSELTPQEAKRYSDKLKKQIPE